MNITAEEIGGFSRGLSQDSLLLYIYIYVSLSLCICIYIYIYTHTYTCMYVYTVVICVAFQRCDNNLQYLASPSEIEFMYYLVALCSCLNIICSLCINMYDYL